MSEQLILRKPWGQGFRYKYKESGRYLSSQSKKEWIKGLAIPPAWQEVVIDLNKKAKIYAWGRDSKGRKQYVYNDNWRARREERKFDRIVEFASRLSHMRRVTGQHMATDQLGRKRVLASMVRMLDESYFRVGNPSYYKENKTIGLTTLRSKHLNVEDDVAAFDYKGKSGQIQHREIANDRLIQVIEELDQVPGYEIFKFKDGSTGKWRKVSPTLLNDYIHEVMGERFTGKDFRTWAGTYLAATLLAKLGPEDKEDLRNKKIINAVDHVASTLGNTRNTARSSYIDPRIIERYNEGRTIQDLVEKIKKEWDRKKWSTPEEKAVCDLIQNQI